MRLKTCLVSTVLAMFVGVGCSSAAPAPKVSGGAVTTSSTSASFDPQAYCVEKLGVLAAKYPKSLGGSDLAAECRKMISETGATSAKTVDALLATAETFYKTFG